MAHATLSTKLELFPEICDSIALSSTIPTTASSILLASEDGVAEWRQYVPLAVSVAVIIDILLGSPLANLALGPMKRASEKGATGGDSMQDEDGGGGGGSLFSAFGGSDTSGGVKDSGRGRERVDSFAIAQAALNKAEGTLELKRFLEENKSDEDRFEDMRKKINRQMEELED